MLTSALTSIPSLYSLSISHSFCYPSTYASPLSFFPFLYIPLNLSFSPSRSLAFFIYFLHFHSIFPSLSLFFSPLPSPVLLLIISHFFLSPSDFVSLLTLSFCSFAPSMYSFHSLSPLFILMTTLTLFITLSLVLSLHLSHTPDLSFSLSLSSPSPNVFLLSLS